MMFFELTDEQKSLQEAARDFLATHPGPDAARARIASNSGFDRELWMRMANELGLQSITIPEEHGGAGAGLVELAIVLTEMGRSLYSGPFFSTVALGATALRSSADNDAMGRYLPGIASGELTATLCTYDEGHLDFSRMATRARWDNGRWLISGEKAFVIDGDLADLVLVPALTDAGPTLFAVHAGADGLTRTALSGLDPTTRLADLRFVDVEGDLLGVPGEAEAGLRHTMAVASISLSAEQVGGAEACLEMAVSYSKVRQQFGRTIGSFQAVKHKCADMYLKAESAKTLMYQAAWSSASDKPDAALLAELSSAFCSDAFFFCASQNLQILGAIGYTWEHDAHFYFKRARSSAQLLGSPASHRESAADALLSTPRKTVGQ